MSAATLGESERRHRELARTILVTAMLLDGLALLAALGLPTEPSADVKFAAVAATAPECAEPSTAKRDPLQLDSRRSCHDSQHRSFAPGASSYRGITSRSPK